MSFPGDPGSCIRTIDLAGTHNALIVTVRGGNALPHFQQFQLMIFIRFSLSRLANSP